jgi:hypothetical protein
VAAPAFIAELVVECTEICVCIPLPPVEIKSINASVEEADRDSNSYPYKLAAQVLRANHVCWQY